MTVEQRIIEMLERNPGSHVIIERSEDAQWIVYFKNKARTTGAIARKPRLYEAVEQVWTMILESKSQ